ncbi:MAG: DNA polymerase II [Desulfobacterales bacterium]|nr:DNA polymerase II [Desulfobacterales bacterium]
MEEFHGYILTRDYRDVQGRHELCFQGIGDHGPFEIIITGNRPLFFMHQGDPLPELPFVCQRKPLELSTFGGEAVDAVYFQTQNQLYQAREILEKEGIRTHEADLRPEERYLMERFIFGGIAFSGPCQTRNGLPRFTDPQIRPAFHTPAFSILSLDIETGRGGELYSIGLDFLPGGPGDQDRRGRVFMLDPSVKNSQGMVTELEGGGTMVRLPGERDLILAFLQLLGQWDPDILVGWHVVGFDLAFLENKCQALGLKLKMGRDGSPVRLREVRKGSYHASARGRIIIDGPPALRNAFYTFENFRLETVARELLGQGKDIGETGDKVEEIERRFRGDKPALARYNLLDARLVTDIFETTGLIDLTFKRAVISGLPMDRVGFSVAAFEHYMLPKIHRKGLVAPNVKDLEDRGHAAGGLVFASTPGFYEQIGVFDFKSLYPSIIRTFKIDPLSRLRAETDSLNTPVDIPFSRTEHVLPAYIKELLDKREQAKADGDPHLSQAVKILMNSFYGVMGTLGCRFYHPNQSRAITGTGQWILKTTKAFLEEQGYAVIYGDTDSVFVRLKKDDGQIQLAGAAFVPSGEDDGDDAPDWDGEARALARSINDFLTQKLETEFGVDSHLELEYEKRFSRFFLPALRGGGNGAKKRYAGLVVKGEGEELVFTGLEFVRSDWTRFAKDFQYELFQRIFQGRDVFQWIRKTVADLKAGDHDGALIYKKRLTKPASEYVKVIPPHVKAALMLGPDPPREILYVMTQRGAVPIELPHGDLDYNHYIQKQLKPIADAVLLFFDQSFSQVMGGRQMQLF